MIRSLDEDFLKRRVFTREKPLATGFARLSFRLVFVLGTFDLVVTDFGALAFALFGLGPLFLCPLAFGWFAFCAATRLFFLDGVLLFSFVVLRSL
jgi:hypothetical protein